MPNFPSNPTVGQVYTLDVRAWRWNGAAWDLIPISDAQVTRAENAANRAEAAAATIGTTAAFVDSNPIVKGSTDATKQARVEVDGFTSGTTHTFILPNKPGTFALMDDVTNAGDLVLIASVTPTATAAVDLANIFSDAYEHYLIVFTDLAGTTSQGVQLRAITDGATVVSSSNYYGGPTLNTDVTSGVTSMVATSANTGGTVARSSATIRVHRGASTFFDITGMSLLSSIGLSATRNAYLAYASNITGVRLFLNTGAFGVSGRINVYAFSKS